MFHMLILFSLVNV